MEAYKINTGQKKAIEKNPFAQNQFFNPVQDINGEWFIGESEINSLIQHQGWKNAMLSEYVPPTPPEAI